MVFKIIWFRDGGAAIATGQDEGRHTPGLALLSDPRR
jgi:hypothetical protein